MVEPLSDYGFAPELKRSPWDRFLDWLCLPLALLWHLMPILPQIGYRYRKEFYYRGLAKELREKNEEMCRMLREASRANPSTPEDHARWTKEGAELLKQLDPDWKPPGPDLESRKPWDAMNLKGDQ